jgi:TonB family protein
MFAWRAVICGYDGARVMKRCLSVALCVLGIAGGGMSALGGGEDFARQLGLARFGLPEFPPVLRSEGVTAGSASLLITHDAAGRLVDILLLDATQPEFGEAAMRAVREWQFVPAAPGAPRLQRTPVVRFNFSVKGVVIVPTGGRAVEYSLPPLSAAAETVSIPMFDRLDRTPRAIVQPMPQFPPALLGQVGEGWAKLEFLVDTEGRVRVPVVLEESAPAFGDAALAAVAAWRFGTPRENGQPVVAMTQWEFRFRPATAEAPQGR